MNHIIHSTSHILSNWFCKKKHFLGWKLAIDSISLYFSYVIHAFDTLKVEHLLDREYAKNWSTTYQLYAILAGDHCKNHILRIKIKAVKRVVPWIENKFSNNLQNTLLLYVHLIESHKMQSCVYLVSNLNYLSCKWE